MNNKYKLLLVEDEAPKRAHILSFLKVYCDTIDVQIAKSVNSAEDCLDNDKPDIIFLDMSLPTFDVGERESGGRPQGFGGIEVLRYMAMSDICCPTIVITGYDAFIRSSGKAVELSQIKEELLEEFPDIIKGVLHYNSTLDEWRLALADALSHLISEGGK